jgi:hypothetical protein
MKSWTGPVAFACLLAWSWGAVVDPLPTQRGPGGPGVGFLLGEETMRLIPLLDSEGDFLEMVLGPGKVRYARELEPPASSGEVTTQGRVLLISLPTAESRFTRNNVEAGYYHSHSVRSQSVAVSSSSSSSSPASPCSETQRPIRHGRPSLTG